MMYTQKEKTAIGNKKLALAKLPWAKNEEILRK